LTNGGQYTSPFFKEKEMKRFRLDMAQAVRGLLIQLPPPFKQKVKLAFHALAEDPYQANPLKDELAGLRSFRVMRSRIIFRIKGSFVEIVAFGPRKDNYHRAATELRSAMKSKQEPK
jgi:mRNA-degrading endonuclease RelE of RelBE toxin-antitoxin system